MKKIILLMLPAILILGSCSHKTTKDAAEKTDGGVAVGYTGATRQNHNDDIAPEVKLVKPDAMVLKATAFQMSGDYSNNVAVTLNDAGNLAYYPAPTDITVNSRPIDLGNGWWLNQQGLGPNSVFTKYTFDQYSSLDKVPTREEIIDAIIPGAYVTRFVQLPCAASEAQSQLSEIKEFLKNE